MSGCFTLIYGPMFAGKTSRLLSFASQQLAGSYHIFKPMLDKRSKTNCIESHEGKTLSSTDIEHSTDILMKISDLKDGVLIDECQFFDSDIVEVVLKLVEKGKNVIAAGLLYDAQGVYFGPMKTLFDLADKRIALYAQCDICSAPASNTHCKVERPEVVFPGGKDVYMALCNGCYAAAN